MRVIKIGGRAQGDQALPGALVAAWRAAPGSLVVVHGGGDEVSAVQRRLGSEPTFSGGRRVTTADDLEVVRMVLSGTINKRLATQHREVQAVGVSGEDAGLLEAVVTDPRLGRVGTPQHVNPALLARLLTGGFLPVVSPLGRDAAHPEVAGLNVNGDDAAAAIAVALAADELLLIADVAGVLDEGVLVRTLDPAQAAALIESGVAGGGMAAKLQAACAALEGGVGRVRIGPIAAITDSTAGTILSLASHPA